MREENRILLPCSLRTVDTQEYNNTSGVSEYEELYHNIRMKATQFKKILYSSPRKKKRVSERVSLGVSPRVPARLSAILLARLLARLSAPKSLAESLGSDYMDDSRRDSLRDSFFYAGLLDTSVTVLFFC